MRKIEQSQPLGAPASGTHEREGAHRSWSKAVLGILLIAFVISAVYAASSVYRWTRQVVRSLPAATTVELPRVVLPASAQAPSQPLAGPEAPLVAAPQAMPRAAVPLTLEAANASKRVTVLLLGVDQRPDDPSPPRTDNMIVVTLEPESGQAGMISLPRDLFVPIAGYDRNRKINTAYVIGETSAYPGGGGALAKRTVSDFLGYPIDYYIKMNFDGFERFIDLIGGIDVEVPKTIHDDRYPTIDYGFTTFHIDAGPQRMDGTTALKYVRTRNTDNDFERARRQQQVLLGIKDQMLENKLLTTLRVFDLLDVLTGSVEHDIPAAELLDLVNLAGKTQVAGVEQLILDNRYGTVRTDSRYGWILVPDREKIRPAVDKIFANTEPAPRIDQESLARLQAQQQAELARQQVQNSYEALAETLRSQLAAEGARILLENGTGDPNLTDRAADWLRSQGYNIVDAGEAKQSDYPRTVLLVHNEKPLTVTHLVDSFAIAGDNIRHSTDEIGDVDLRLIVGRDFYLLVSN